MKAAAYTPWDYNQSDGNELPHDKTNKMTYAPSEDSNQPFESAQSDQNVSSYINHNAVYILFLVLWNQCEYSGKSEINDLFRVIF